MIGVGKVRAAYIREGIAGYTKRIKRYLPLDTHDIKEERQTPGRLLSVVLKKEGERILSKLEGADFVVVLHEAGTHTTSRGLAGHMERLLSGGKKRLCIITGGAYGLHPSVIERADMVLSLSEMTFPHELARLIVAEQVYRAFTIMRGEPYSH